MKLLTTKSVSELFSIPTLRYRRSRDLEGEKGKGSRTLSSLNDVAALGIRGSVR